MQFEDRAGKTRQTRLEQSTSVDIMDSGRRQCVVVRIGKSKKIRYPLLPDSWERNRGNLLIVAVCSRTEYLTKPWSHRDEVGTTRHTTFLCHKQNAPLCPHLRVLRALRGLAAIFRMACCHRLKILSADRSMQPCRRGLRRGKPELRFLGAVFMSSSCHLSTPPGQA